MREVTVDLDRCVGTGNCEFVAPDYFRVNDDGVSNPLIGTVAGPVPPPLREAELGCPAMAIHVRAQN